MFDSKTVLATCLTSLCFCSPVLAQQEIADDAKMARHALAPYVRGARTAEEKTERKNRHHRQIQEREKGEPNREVVATVVFARGLTAQEVSELAGLNKLEVMALSIKAPYDERGTVQSIEVGSATMARFDGELYDRI